MEQALSSTARSLKLNTTNDARRAYLVHCTEEKFHDSRSPTRVSKILKSSRVVLYGVAQAYGPTDIYYFPVIGLNLDAWVYIFRGLGALSFLAAFPVITLQRDKLGLRHRAEPDAQQPAVTSQLRAATGDWGFRNVLRT